jgi:curli production assembly/transport component CsgF
MRVSIAPLTGAISLRAAAAAGGIAIASLAPGAAQAQDLVHQFNNPSFGGNPFNSEHLRAIAELDRPKAPTDDAGTPSAEELLASQIRSQLTSSLSLTILSTIQNAQPGQSGNFTLGDQRISYVRTATETRVTFFNTRTGVTSELIIPVNPAGSGSAPGMTSAAAGSAEQLLGGAGSLPLTGQSANQGTTTQSLLPPPPL